MERQQSSLTDPRTTLLSLNQEYQAVAAELVELGGELNEEVEKRLDRVCSALCEKADGYGIVTERLENEIEFWKYQTQKCAAVKKTFDGALTKLKDRMRFVLRQMPGEAIQGELYRFFLAKSKDGIDVDLNQLPDEYKTTEIRLVADMEKISAAISEGKAIQGVQVTRDNRSLRQGRPK